MNVIIDNQSIDLNTTQFVHFMDGVSLFVGLTDVNQEVFVPFYWYGGHYNSGYLFDSEETIRITDKEEELGMLSMSAQAVADEYQTIRAQFPQAVTNIDLFTSILTEKGGVLA